MIVALILFDLRATQVSDGQNNGNKEGRTDKGKPICPHLSEWGHKNTSQSTLAQNHPLFEIICELLILAPNHILLEKKSKVLILVKY
jgi:hypothetical protein